MEHGSPSIPHPHLTRRCSAAAAALVSTFVWLMIYSALWQAKVIHDWVHHAILLAGTALAFGVPCVLIWLLAQGYDHLRHLRKL